MPTSPCGRCQLRGPQAAWLTALCIAIPSLAVAQRLPIRTYTTADGLAHNRVNRIVRDTRGFLWFCTSEGLSRFDGYTFTNFGPEQGLPHPSVNDVLETHGGDYWVATNGGLVHFDPRGMPNSHAAGESEARADRPMFTVIEFADQEKRPGSVTVLREGRDGTIWAGTSSGLYRLKGTNGHRSLEPVEVGIPSDNEEQRLVGDLLEDARGSLWIAAPSGLYRRWPDGSAARYTERDGLPADPTAGGGAYPHCLLEDHNGRLWLGTRLNGFFRFTADETHRPPVVDMKFTYPGDLPTTWVFRLFETSEHRFWVAMGMGVAEFFPNGDEQGRHFHFYAARNGLSDHDITALSEDAGGNLWFGTASAGAMKLSRAGFATYAEQHGILSVQAIFQDQSDRLCFRGTVLGDARTSVFEGAMLPLVSVKQPRYYARLGCFDGQRFDWFKPAGVTDPGWVGEGVTLQSRSREWWVGTGEGLYRFPAADSLGAVKTTRPLAAYRLAEGLATPQVFRLFEDSAGHVWVSTISSAINGLARWDPARAQMQDLAAARGLPSLKDELPRSFAEDRSGTVWIGFTHGLARYVRGAFTWLAASDGLPSGAINAIHVDHSGRIWLAPRQSGLVRIDEPDSARPTFVSYTTAQGLSSDNIEVITEDGGGHLYLGGGRGLDRFDPATASVRHFTTADGLPVGLFRAAFTDRSGVLWFGMTSGLVRLDGASESPSGPPPILISGLQVAGVPRAVSALGEQQMLLPDLAPRQNDLQIDFVGVGFRTGDVLRYQYKLAGDDWSLPSERRTVAYASLAAGRYTFRVRAVNSAGLASADPATITFTILRPVWQRWWFLCLGMFAIGMAGYSLYRYRVARLLEMADMRTRIASDLHDDIGANLTRIALLSEMAQQGHTRTDGPLSSIARIARESVGSMSDIVWAINPARDTLLDLIRRMRQHADEIFTMRGIELQFNVPGDTHGVRLDVDVRQDLLRIFKEAANNAARHSRCSHVQIVLRMEPSRLILELRDNGAGFDTSLASEGQGLLSMQRRARRLQGHLHITSGTKSGTTVTLAMPLRSAVTYLNS